MTSPDWRLLPSLSALRAFEAAARLGSFAAAARALSVTPPAVAQQVRALESELGIALFRKAGRGQALTAPGADLARALGDGFGTIAEGVARIRQVERRRGLRLSTPPAFTQLWLLPRLAEFWRRHPEIAVSVVPSNRAVDLAREGFDLAVRVGEGPWPGLRAVRLVATPMRLVAAPELVATGRPLGSLPWLIDPENPIEAAWVRACGFDPAELEVRALDDPGLLSAKAGYGVVFATGILADPEIAAGRLVELPASLPEMVYWAVSPLGPEPPALAGFVAWLRAELSPGG